MSDLNELKESILAQAREKGQAKLDTAIREHEEIFKSKEQALLTEREGSRQRQLTQLKNEHQRLVQQLNNKERQSSLASKQEVLNELFQGAVELMNQWTSDRHQAFFTNVMKDFMDQKLSVQFGEFSKAALAEDIALKYPNLTVENDTIKNQGGFVLSDGKVDYNYLYSTLVQSMKLESGLNLANKIFDNE